MEKLICLISGGIDSPVSAYMMRKKGYEIIFLNISPKKEIKSIEKVKSLIKIISPNSKLYIVDNQDLMKETIKYSGPNTCLICKIFMMKLAEKIAQEEKAKAILTGDNLAQVASQTMANLIIEERAVRIPIIRPLIGFDKIDIINIAKQIGTFDISVSFAPPCLYVPKKPSTRAKQKEIIELERKINLNKFLEKSLLSAEKIIVS